MAQFPNTITQPGAPYTPPLRDDMPPPEVPKRKMSWFVKLLIGFAALLLIGLAIGFAQTAVVPSPTIDTSPMDAPVSPATPQQPSPTPQ